MGDSTAGAPVRANGGTQRFPLLDGIRALATVSVVAFHVPFATGMLADTGWRAWVAYLTFGPPLFFILSGFLLYRPFVVAAVEGRSVRTWSFFRKRAMRIFPAYWVLLTVFWVWPGLPIAGDDVWKYYGLTHVYFTDTVLGGLGVSWTLCTELAFYAVLPFAALVLLKVPGSRLTPQRARLVELATLAVVAVLSAAYLWLLMRRQPFTTGLFAATLTLPGQACMFAVGMALARLTVPLPGERPLRDRIPHWTVLSTACWGLAALVYWVRIERDISTGAAAPLANGLIATLIILPAVFARPGDRGLERMLGGRFLAWLALVSYGIYLAHGPIIELLHGHAGIGDPSAPATLLLFGLVLAISVAIGAATYYAVERPLNRFKYAGARARPPRPGGAPAPSPTPAPAAPER